MTLQSIAGRRSRNGRSGFTLTEMLVSVAVLVIIMTFIAQMMDNVSISTTLSSKHIDTDNQARLTFDRMAVDFAGMLQRPDLDFIFAKQGVNNTNPDLNDKMFFYSEAPAYFDTGNHALFPSGGTEANPKSDVALIGYIIDTSTNNNTSSATTAYRLERLSMGLTWDQGYPGNNTAGINFLVFSPAAQGNSMRPLLQTTMSGNSVTGQEIGAPPDYVAQDFSNYDVLANQVFRMEYAFQVKDLSNGATGATAFSQFPVAKFNASGATSGNQAFTDKTLDPSLTDDLGGVVGDRWYNSTDHRSFILSARSAPGVTPQTNTWSPLGMSDVTAIVVTIAVMDTNSRKVLSYNELTQTAAQLPDFNKGEDPTNATSSVQLPATTWAAALNQLPAGSFAGLAGIPQAAAGQIRVYQHFFYLNNNH
jgi:prepilin-type N-terminal cleavage/methylation domain-containing protein